MAKSSKYQDSQINDILQDMIAVLEKHQAPVDLSLMVLGNMATHLIRNNVPVAQQQTLAETFNKALLHSLKVKA